MKQIKLSNCDKYTLVDDDIYEKVKHHTWRMKATYADRTLNIRTPKGRIQVDEFLHHVVLPRKEGMFTDHINRNRLDNRRENLRYSTPSQNQVNRTFATKSKYRGVRKEGKKWEMRICANHKRVSLCFKSEMEAALSYNEHAIAMHGEFAILNVVE